LEKPVSRQIDQRVCRKLVAMFASDIVSTYTVATDDVVADNVVADNDV